MNFYKNDRTNRIRVTRDSHSILRGIIYDEKKKVYLIAVVTFRRIKKTSRFPVKIIQLNARCEKKTHTHTQYT